MNNIGLVINVAIFTLEKLLYLGPVYFWKVAVILLQIVMVSPGTHLVKNHESQFKKKKGVLEGKCLDVYVTR